MKMLLSLFFLLLAPPAQGQRPVSQYILDWSPKSGQVTLICRDTPHRPAQVFAAQNLDPQLLARALDVPPNARALLYVHCWLGETRFFHRRSMGWLSHALQASADTSPVVLIALRWPSGKPGYRHSANQAGKKGAGAAPLLRALSEVFPDGRLDVFCHSMGNRFFQGCVAVTGSEGMPQLGRVVLFSPDVDADVFCGDFEKLAAASQSLHLYTHRHDRALWLSQRQLHRPRLGRSGPTALPGSMVLDITDMTHLRSLSNHTHFADKAVQQDLGRVFGPGERADFLRNPNSVWTVEIEQDWAGDIPSLEAEQDEGITTLKLLNQEGKGLHWPAAPTLAALVAAGAAAGEIEIFNDAACAVPINWRSLFSFSDNHSFDPESNEGPVQVDVCEIAPTDVKGWRLRQSLTYRAKTATWSTQVQAVAPLIEIKNAEGDSIGTRPFFWFRPDDKRPKLTSNHIVWAKEMVNKRAKTEVPLSSFKSMKRVGDIPELLLHLQEVVEKKMNVPLYNSAGDGLLSAERRRTLLHPSDTFVYCFSEGPNGESIGILRHEWLPRAHHLRLVQTWYWDERSHRLSICLDAVAPLADVLDNEGAFRYRRPLFYWRTRR